MQSVPFPRKERMFLHMQKNIKIAGRASERTGFAAASKANSSTVFNTGGNFRINRTLAENASLPFALHARISNHVTAALAGGTGACNAEKSLLIAHLAATRAGTASSSALPWRAPCPVAFFARL